MGENGDNKITALGIDWHNKILTTGNKLCLKNPIIGYILGSSCPRNGFCCIFPNWDIPVKIQWNPIHFTYFPPFFPKWEFLKVSCERFVEIQALLPVKSNQFLGIAKENSFLIPGKESKIRPRKEGEVKDIARALYNKIDATFQKVCSTSFGEVSTKLPELQLEKRKSPTKAKREKRQMYRKYKQKVVDEWEKTSLLR